MSEIGEPPRPEAIPTEASTRVARGASTSDHGSAENHPQKNNPNIEKKPPSPEKTQYHDPAVTISASLAKLEEGQRFTAEIKGHDPDKRPIMTSEHGTYIMQPNAKDKILLEQLPKGYEADIRITSLKEDIKAQLIIHRDYKTAEKLGKPPLEVISITLILTGFGTEDLNPTISEKNNVSMSEIAAHYPDSAIFKAEAAAQKSLKNPLNDIAPLPITASKYTLFEKITSFQKDALQQNTPAKNKVINPLFIQESISSPLKKIMPTTVSTAAPINKDEISKLLHKPAIISLVRNFQNSKVTLPPNIPKNLKNNIIKTIGDISIPDIFTKGNQSEVSIISVAIPEDHSQIDPKEVFSKDIFSPARKNSHHISAIVINPKESLIDKISAESLSPKSAKKNAPHNAKNTILLATPTAIISLKSDLKIPVGTIIHFTAGAAIKTTPKIPPQAIIAQRSQYPHKMQPLVKENPQKIINKILQNPAQNPAVQNSSTSQTRSSSISQPAKSITTVNQPINARDQEKNKISAPPLLPKIHNISELLKEWESLNYLIDSLNRENYGAMAEMIASKIPNIKNPAQISSGIIFFMAALKRSFIEGKNPTEIWLGRNLVKELSRNGHGKLLARINNEITRIGDLNNDIHLREWRPMLIPMSSDNEIFAIPFFIKRKQQDLDDSSQNKNNIDEKENTRFMIELNLSKMGKVFIDGMLTQKKLEIILKSASNISGDFKKTIIQKFDAALDKYNYSGSLVIHDDFENELSLKKMIFGADAVTQNSSSQENFSTLT